MGAGSGLFKSLRPGFLRGIQSTDVSSAAMWGVAAGSAAIWLIQPFDWIKAQFTKKPETEGA